jgi:plasmid segregation protein ParM
VVNDESKIPLVIDTIESAIAKLGERVVDELAEFRHVNRVYIVGGGASLIAPAVKAAWHHLGQKVVMMDNPQMALVQAIAVFKGE